MDPSIKQISYGPEVEALLSNNSLPTSDLGGESKVYWFGMHSNECLVGVVGIEAYGSVALLRSLAVATSARAGGYGRSLVADAEAWALQSRVKKLYLLTETAAEYFARLGYVRLPRSEAPSAIARTSQFSGLCASSAAFMGKELCNSC
ncbi:MAG: arsenic resistance N-acetyltransferase ArsN2 [Gammaproteobacteria bacterium]